MLHRWLFGCLYGVVLGLYRVKHAQRDVQACEKMRGLQDVQFDQFGLSSELLLPGMKRKQQQQQAGDTEARGGQGGAGSLHDEFTAAEQEREQGGRDDAGTEEGDLNTSSSGLLPALDLSLTADSTSPSTSSSTLAALAPYHYALSLLSGLATIADPYDKLSCVLKVARAICRSVDEAHGGQAVVINADDLLLLFTYLIITLTNGDRSATTRH